MELKGVRQIKKITTVAVNMIAASGHRNRRIKLGMSDGKICIVAGHAPIDPVTTRAPFLSPSFSGLNGNSPIGELTFIMIPFQLISEFVVLNFGHKFVFVEQ